MNKMRCILQYLTVVTMLFVYNVAIAGEETGSALFIVDGVDDLQFLESSATETFRIKSNSNLVGATLDIPGLCSLDVVSLTASTTKNRMLLAAGDKLQISPATDVAVSQVEIYVNQCVYGSWGQTEVMYDNDFNVISLLSPFSSASIFTTQTACKIKAICVYYKCMMPEIPNVSFNGICVGDGDEYHVARSTVLQISSTYAQSIRIINTTTGIEDLVQCNVARYPINEDGHYEISGVKGSARSDVLSVTFTTREPEIVEAKRNLTLSFASPIFASGELGDEFDYNMLHVHSISTQTNDPDERFDGTSMMVRNGDAIMLSLLKPGMINRMAIISSATTGSLLWNFSVSGDLMHDVNGSDCWTGSAPVVFARSVSDGFIAAVDVSYTLMLDKDCYPSIPVVENEGGESHKVLIDADGCISVVVAPWDNLYVMEVTGETVARNSFSMDAADINLSLGWHKLPTDNEHRALYKIDDSAKHLCFVSERDGVTGIPVVLDVSDGVVTASAQVMYNQGDTGVQQWFDMQGRQVRSPSMRGVYLRRCGNRIEKIFR